MEASIAPYGQQVKEAQVERGYLGRALLACNASAGWQVSTEERQAEQRGTRACKKPKWLSSSPITIVSCTTSGTDGCLASRALDVQGFMGLPRFSRLKSTTDCRICWYFQQSIFLVDVLA